MLSEKIMTLYKLSYYLEPDSHVSNKTKVELELSNYATKCNIKKQQVLIHQYLKKRLIQPA